MAGGAEIQKVIMSAYDVTTIINNINTLYHSSRLVPAHLGTFSAIHAYTSGHVTGISPKRSAAGFCNGMAGDSGRGVWLFYFLGADTVNSDRFVYVGYFT